MHLNHDELRQIVDCQFKTRRDFGARMGWNECKVTRILNGYQFPTLPDLWRIVEVCNMNELATLAVFFAEDVC